MPELRLAITQQQSVTGSHWYKLWTIDSGISYTGSIGWRITDPSIVLNTESTLLWMDDKASSPCLKTGGTHRSRHSKSMDTTSLNRSDIFMLMIGTYLSLSSAWFDWQHNAYMYLASYPGPRAERGKGPGDTWQNSCMCWVSVIRNKH